MNRNFPRSKLGAVRHNKGGGRWWVVVRRLRMRVSWTSYLQRRVAYWKRLPNLLWQLFVFG